MAFYATKSVTEEGHQKLTLSIVGLTSLLEFNRVLGKALSTDAPAPVALRELTDLLEHGAVLQSYVPMSDPAIEERIASERDATLETAAQVEPAHQHDMSVQDAVVLNETPQERPDFAAEGI